MMSALGWASQKVDVVSKEGCVNSILHISPNEWGLGEEGVQKLESFVDIILV